MRRPSPGVTIAVRTRVYGVPVFMERLEVLDWDPPSRLVMAHRSFVGGTGTWSLAPAGISTVPLAARIGSVRKDGK